VSKPGRQSGQGSHVFSLRVQWEDTDALGMVYYANHLRFIERARSAMLAGLGIDQTALLAAQGLAFAVKSCLIEYLRPARLHDALDVRTRLVALCGASIELEQSIWREHAAIARARVRLACINSAGRPQRLPGPLAASFATLSPSFSFNWTSTSTRNPAHGDAKHERD
jgi:acyl-CoA thioester hydrolase